MLIPFGLWRLLSMAAVRVTPRWRSVAVQLAGATRWPEVSIGWAVRRSPQAKQIPQGLPSKGGLPAIQRDWQEEIQQGLLGASKNATILPHICSTQIVDIFDRIVILYLSSCTPT